MGGDEGGLAEAELGEEAREGSAEGSGDGSRESRDGEEKAKRAGSGGEV